MNAPHTYAGGDLDRVHSARQNPAFVSAQFERADALFLPFLKLKPLLRSQKVGEKKTQAPVWLSLARLRSECSDASIIAFEGSSVDWVLLGIRRDEVPLFAIDVTPLVWVCRNLDNGN
jgi:hypothetical protein